MATGRVAVAFCLLTFFFVVDASIADNRTPSGAKEELRFAGANNVTAHDNPAAVCYDRRLANFLNSGLAYYAHDMGALAKYILDQIVRGKLGGIWFVHAQMIQTQRQGLEWQSVTNGDLFAASSRHGCYYHDTQTYVIILNY